MTKRAKAYSYLRFSTPEQSQGDSSRRQTKAAKDLAERLDLDLQALTFEDLGVSGYRGKNVVKGALGAFLEAVDNGTVPQGSFLLVEDLDRLGRQKLLSAFDTFRAVLSRVNIANLKDGKVYDLDSLNSLSGLLLPLLDMDRANAESLRKEKISRANWAQKRRLAVEEQKPMTAIAPAWLRLEGGKYEVIEVRAATVRYIFELALQGLGKAAICRRLNSEGVATFTTSRAKAKSWHASTIHAIMTGGAVVGHFQPCHSVFDDAGKRTKVPNGPVIENYYPAVVALDVFLRVKHSKAGISGKGKRHGIKNALAGLAVCGECGANMVFVNRGAPGKSGKVYTYLSCDAVRRKLSDCKAPSVSYGDVLGQVIALFDDFGDRYVATRADADSRQRDLESLDAQIADLQERVERLLDAVEGGTSKGTQARLEAREAELEALKTRRTETQERATVVDAENGSAEDDAAMLEELRGRSSEDIESADIAWLNRQLKRHLDRIEVAKGSTPVLVQRM